MDKLSYIDLVLIENARRIIYTYGSVEECAKDYDVDINCIQTILSGNYEDDRVRLTVSSLLKYPI